MLRCTARVCLSLASSLVFVSLATGQTEKTRRQSDPSQDSRSGGADELSGADKGSRYDPSLVQAGEEAFNNYCTQCHDAQKALQKTKGLAAWRATVQRMGAKSGADIPQNVYEAIATYLASRGDTGKAATDASGRTADEAPPFSLAGTIAPSWRGGGSTDTTLQDPGFFANAWVTAAWQSKGPVSAVATACTSCHNQGNQFGRLELAEAKVRLDVTNWLGCGSGCDPMLKTSVEAGRLIVPFGAFYQHVNPAVDRAVSQPLIYNMGQRVRADDLGGPVLPMPYSDEGAVVNLSLPVLETATASFDTYVVNGLQGDANGIDFLTSRNYVDNNSSPAVGARLAFGGKHLRLGGSIMGGRFNAEAPTGPLSEPMDYVVYGADVLFRWEDLLRVQFEYAERDSDRLAFVSGPTLVREHVGGCYLEGESLLSRRSHLSLFARYDTQSRRSPLPPPGSRFPTGDFTVQRFTYGLNWSTPLAGLLSINHEHWFLPGDLHDVDVLGVRWAVTF